MDPVDSKPQNEGAHETNQVRLAGEPMASGQSPQPSTSGVGLTMTEDASG